MGLEVISEPVAGCVDTGTVLVRITSHCAVSVVRVWQWEALNWSSLLTDSLCGSLVSVTMVLVLHLMGYSEPLEETVLQHPSGEHSPACCAMTPTPDWLFDVAGGSNCGCLGPGQGTDLNGRAFRFSVV